MADEKKLTPGQAEIDREIEKKLAAPAPEEKKPAQKLYKLKRGAAAEPKATPIDLESGRELRQGEAPEEKSRSVAKKRTEHEEFLLHSHKGMPILYPGIFRGTVIKLVYDYLWNHGKLAEKKRRKRKKKRFENPLRWEGYEKDIAMKIKRSYRQVIRALNRLVDEKVIHRWHRGNTRGGKTVFTIAKNPADFIRMRMIRMRKDRKEAKEWASKEK